MSAHANPDIIDDGLVFLYDTDDGKSYKGEPTTNLITNSGTSNTGWVGYGWTGSQAISNDYPNTYEFTATNGWHNRTFDTGVTSGGTIYVTFQYKLKQQQTTQNQIFVLNGTSLGSYTNYIGNGSMSFEWQTFSGSFTANANSSKIAIGPRGQDSSGLTDIVYIRNLQVEQKPHATPFVNGTRSATQGLLDRTGSSTIDISNASFDSNAQMTFDGTDDYINDASFDMGTPTDITLECIIRFNGSLDSADRKVMHYNKGGSNGVFQLRKGDSASRLMYQAHNGSQWYTMTDTDAIESDTWAHFMITHSGTSAIMYKNGVQSATATMGNLHWTNANNLLIGYRANSEYWKGDIPTMKIYNRALTAAEVLQNFNATKSRFGL
jgi:hypothetical protein